MKNPVLKSVVLVAGAVAICWAGFAVHKHLSEPITFLEEADGPPAPAGLQPAPTPPDAAPTPAAAPDEAPLVSEEPPVAAPPAAAAPVHRHVLHRRRVECQP